MKDRSDSFMSRSPTHTLIYFIINLIGTEGLVGFYSTGLCQTAPKTPQLSYIKLPPVVSHYPQPENANAATSIYLPNEFMPDTIMIHLIVQRVPVSFWMKVEEIQP